MKKILTLNCWLLPRPISLDAPKRLKKITTLIKEEDPDIIALQEVWLISYVRSLAEELKDYAFFYTYNTVFNTSGLVTAVKRVHYNVVKFEQEFFTQSSTFIERLSKKGFHKITLPGITVVNTHLFDGNYGKPAALKNTTAGACTIHQLGEILLKQSSIVVGDLNIDQEFLTSLPLFKHNFSYQVSNKPTVSVENEYTNARWNKTIVDSKFDYILPTIQSGFSIIEEVLDTYMLSDHYQVIGKIV